MKTYLRILAYDSSDALQCARIFTLPNLESYVGNTTVYFSVVSLFLSYCFYMSTQPTLYIMRGFAILTPCRLVNSDVLGGACCLYFQCLPVHEHHHHHHRRCRLHYRLLFTTLNSTFVSVSVLYCRWWRLLSLSSATCNKVINQSCSQATALTDRWARKKLYC